MKFVDKQLALKLKEKGFDKPCFGYYQEDEFILNRTSIHIPFGGNISDTMILHQGENDIVDVPTIEQTLEWLREEKKIHISIDVLSSMNKNFMCKQEPRLLFDVRVSYFEEEVFNYHELAEPYFKYEDACIAGIEYAINNLI